MLFIPVNHVFVPLDIRQLSSLVSRGGLAAQSCFLTVLDSGFHAMDSGFQVLDSSLCQRISIVSGITDSLSCIPDSKAQDSRFFVSGTWIPDSISLVGFRIP